MRLGEIKQVRAEALGVNRKNIYHTNLQHLKDEALRANIVSAWLKHPSYGHKRLGLNLKVNHKRVRRVMKKFGLKVPRRKVFFYTTKSTQKVHKYTNLIKDFVPIHAHDLWCSDLSYFKYQGKLFYLATIEDIFTRQVLSFNVGIKHDSVLVLKTIQEAILNTKKLPTIFHSDQGNEFMAQVCTEYLEEQATQISVSDKASPWQNGYQESFFGHFKDEIGDLNRFETIGELIEAVYQQIYYYNHERIHTALKMPPTVYAKQLS
ncbi:MAG: IS3 family transposase [Nitrosotalea sp.]